MFVAIKLIFGWRNDLCRLLFENWVIGGWAGKHGQTREVRRKLWQAQVWHDSDAAYISLTNLRMFKRHKLWTFPGRVMLENMGFIFDIETWKRSLALEFDLHWEMKMRGRGEKLQWWLVVEDPGWEEREVASMYSVHEKVNLVNLCGFYPAVFFPLYKWWIIALRFYFVTFCHYKVDGPKSWSVWSINIIWLMEKCLFKWIHNEGHVVFLNICRLGFSGYFLYTLETLLYGPGHFELYSFLRKYA